MSDITKQLEEEERREEQAPAEKDARDSRETCATNLLRMVSVQGGSSPTDAARSLSRIAW